MTLTEYKKVIKSLSREELEAHIFELFKSSKTFKDIESSYWSEGSNDELLSDLQKRLEKVFWKNNFSLSECKGVLKDYLDRTIDERTKALMHFAFAVEEARLSATYGDFGTGFYNSLVSSAKKYMDYAKQHPSFFRIYETEFEKLIKITDSFGYGVSGDLECLLEEARKEIGRSGSVWKSTTV